MDDWISIRDGLPIDYQSVLIWNGCSVSIAHREPGAPDNEFVDDYNDEFVYADGGRNCRPLQRRSDTWQHPRSVVVADRR